MRFYTQATLALMLSTLGACSVSAGSGSTTGVPSATGIVGVWSVTLKPDPAHPEIDQFGYWAIGGDGKMSGLFFTKGYSLCSNYSYSAESTTNSFRLILLNSVVNQNAVTTRGDGGGQTSVSEFKRADSSLIAPDLLGKTDTRAYTLAANQDATELLAKYCK